MKALFLALVIAISGVSCGPISVSDNNIGDIISVGVNVEADIKSEINASIVNILVALLANIDLGPNPPPLPPLPPLPPFPPTGLPPTGLPPTGLPPTTPVTQPPTSEVTQQPTTPVTQPPTSEVTQQPTTVSPSPFSSIHVDEMIKTIQDIKEQASGANLTKEQREQILREHAQQLVQKLMENRQ
ncbi:AAEL005159-PA [Aedes aegypti]|uniref:AAEL005159-PA n=1 Tax=Aedes aegypti TaxID=7159 RepID=Q17AW9_AEDAE|nr:AAEL005159-PA [Aedes aegypti]